MSKCKKLVKYLKENRSHYEYSKVEDFLVKCCGLKIRRGSKATHIIFYPQWADANDVRNQITIPISHSNKRYVKRFYVKSIWKHLSEMGIIYPEE